MIPRRCNVKEDELCLTAQMMLKNASRRTKQCQEFIDMKTNENPEHKVYVHAKNKENLTK